METGSSAPIVLTSTDQPSQDQQQNPQVEIQVEMGATESLENKSEQSREQQQREKDESEEKRKNEAPCYSQHRVLYNALVNDDCESARQYVEAHPESLKVPISSWGTPLHTAIVLGRTRMAKEFVMKMEEEDLEHLSGIGDLTVLHLAAQNGSKAIAEKLIEKNSNLLRIPNEDGSIPAALAAINGQRDMTVYLYPLTPEDVLNPEKGPLGATFLGICISSGMLDVALDLVKRFPRLATNAPIHQMCYKPSLFESGYSFQSLGSGFPYEPLQRWIYSCIDVSASASTIDTSQIHCKNKLWGLVCGAAQRCVPGINKMYSEKVKHVQAQEILNYICKQMSTMDINNFNQEMFAMETLRQATIKGIYEIVRAIIKCQPDIVTFVDHNKRNVFHHAIEQRQERIFNLLLGVTGYRTGVSDSVDKDGNTLLHLAGELAPIYRLDRFSGPALQMQREIKWFKAVKKIVPTTYHFKRNNYDKTARELFLEKHRELKKEGEKWMKDTATACTVVAALIATITFAAAFTPPGGTNDDGNPKFLYRSSFAVYMICDAFSLFCSVTSLFMFTEMLTTRYAKKDFRAWLPAKMIFGLLFLFICIVTMVVSFGSVLYMVLCQGKPWILYVTLSGAGCPVLYFVVFQIPLIAQFGHRLEAVG